MPVIEGRKQTTTKVIDTFVRLDAGEELLIHFPSELPSDELELLESLVSSLGYFGRAESWVEGRLADDVIPDATWCVARQNGSSSLPDLGGGDVALLAPVSASEYDSWRSAASEQAKRAAFASVRAAAAAKHKQATKTQLAQAEAKIMALYPDDLLGCLLQETADLQQQGWSQPPGSQQILYRRPAGTLERLTCPTAISPSERNRSSRSSMPALPRHARRAHRVANRGPVGHAASGPELGPLPSKSIQLMHRSASFSRLPASGSARSETPGWTRQQGKRSSPSSTASADSQVKPFVTPSTASADSQVKPFVTPVTVHALTQRTMTRRSAPSMSQPTAPCQMFLMLSRWSWNPGNVTA